MSKTILVTGSSRGIGRAIAQLAHEKGYRVIVHGRADSPELQSVHAELSDSVKTFFDVANKDATQNAIEGLLGQVGKIDVLINNVGIGYTGFRDVSEIEDGKALEEYSVNVLGTLHCIQAILPSMLKNGSGSVVNIASIKGQYNLTTMSSLTYGATKAGIIALTKALAKTYPTVRFNSVSPGYVETDVTKQWPPDTFEKIKNGTILGRMAKPEEIAPLVLFIASDEASYITGGDFLVDGGYFIKGK